MRKLRDQAEQASAAVPEVPRWFEAPEYQPLWGVLDELAQLDEPHRRSELRPHEDRATRDPAVASHRERLDKALDALTQFEILHGCGRSGLPMESPALQLLPSLDAWTELIASDSFLRYLNAYLYFGVRMLLRRCFKPEDADPGEPSGKHNRQPWWLEPPPRLSASCGDAVARIHPGPPDSLSIACALRYLDGGAVKGELADSPVNANLAETLELWIRELRPDLKGAVGDALDEIVEGLESWARRQASFYLYLAGGLASPQHPLPDRPELGWKCDTPVVARVALGDLYWIAGVLRADVNAEAKVMGRVVSWLGLLRFRAAEQGDTARQRDLQSCEEILRQVFGVCCDLVQNASDLASLWQLRKAEKARGEDYSARQINKQSSPPKGWRAVYDEELDEVRQQRELRDYSFASVSGTAGRAVVASHSGWSKRLLEGEPVPDLIGIAMSGGGIRSATFNIGVLQGLQELDLLRQVDYISTVSGGGFAGSWLMANVYRSMYWLGRLTPWDRSIRHLREYSNYLAPRTGILSMDTWSLGALWLRNTLLIQLTALAWLLTIFTGVYLERLGFLWLVATSSGKWSGLVLAVCALSVVAALASNLILRKGWLLHRLAVLSMGLLPAWLGASILSARTFAAAQADRVEPLPRWVSGPLGLAAACARVRSSGNLHYGEILQTLLLDRRWAVMLGGTLIGLIILSGVSLFQSINRGKGKAKATLRVLSAACIALLCTVVVHLSLSAVVLVERTFTAHPHMGVRLDFLVFMVAPTLVLLTYATAILLLIGLAGRSSDEAQREWWTRYGAWVLAAASLGLLLPAIVFGSPWLMHWLFSLQRHKGLIKWGAVLSWVATSAGGLLAGHSSRTTGEGSTRSPSLQVLANVGGTVFLLGAAVTAAELLYSFLRAYDDTAFVHGVLGHEAAAGPLLLLSAFAVLLSCSLIFSYRFDLNVFGLSELYRNRLVRCYLGATRWQPGTRNPEPFTQFDFDDDLKLSDLAGNGFRGPFPILNCSMNLSGSSDLMLHTRHSASFTLTPLHCGASRRYVGYRDTAHFAGGMLLGQAVAVSGAAASPNMGYNTAPLVALLLTLFNVRLGWWFPNPGTAQTGDRGPRGLRYLVTELLGLASERRAYVNVTDGGHFENLGIYELVRRRSQLIIACDAECDETMTFTGLANAIRLCATDFGAVIELDLSSLHRGTDGLSRIHSAVGIIRYSNGSVGRIIYMKASLTGDEDATVAQYLSGHPTFPHETTANQFFREEQFESYRRLGQHIVRNALRSAVPRESLIRIAERLMDTTTPAANSSEKFLEHTHALESMWRHLREQHPLQLQRDGFLLELMGHAPHRSVPRLSADVICIGLELLQLMENLFTDLRLDDFWEHPDHRGWALLFMSWARSPRFRMVWQQNHHTFGIRFEHFCATRLGLQKDEPVLRVSPLTRD